MSTSTYLGYEPPAFANYPAQTGMWCRIVVEPDTFTGERFNIGVGIIDNQGKRFAKVMSGKGRLDCIFEHRDAESILMMAEMAKKCFEEGNPPLFDNITFGEPLPLLNQSPAIALIELFNDQVTLAIPQRSEAARPAGWLTKEETRCQIYQLISERLPANQASVLMPQAPMINVQTRGGPSKAVKVPLQPINGAGALESACYSPATVKNHLMDAMLDIQAHANAAGLTRVGMFVLRPSTGLSKRSLMKLDDTIDDVLWRAPKTWRIEIEENTTQLTDKILDWAQVQAA
jgi:hypothetical protein